MHGWCDATHECVSRSKSENLCKRYGNSSHWQYLIIEPTLCLNCSNYITREQCTDSRVCACWVLNRYENSIRSVDQCRYRIIHAKIVSPVWTNRTDMYGIKQQNHASVFGYIWFGLCHVWTDGQTISLGDFKESQSPQKCKSCESHMNYSTCLHHLNCGWCFDCDNPIDGK